MTIDVTNVNNPRSTFQICAWCRGLGKWDISRGQSTGCIVCGGAGKVLVAQPPIYCRQCRGKGRENAANPCLTCAGTGWEGVLGQ